MNRFFNRLANKLIITFTLTISVFIAALIFVSYSRTNEIRINDFISSNKSILKLVNTNFGNYIAQIDELSVSLRKDAKFMEYLTSDPRDGVAQSYIQNQVKILFYFRNDIERLEFFIPNYKMRYTISRTNDKLNLEYKQDLIMEPRYQKAVKGEYFRYLEPLSTQKGNEAKNSFFTFHRALVSIPGWKPLGIVSISFNRLVLDKMMADATNQKGEALCVYDKTNTLFYISDPEMETLRPVLDLMKPAGRNRINGSFQIRLKGKAYLVVFDQSEQNDWKIAKLIPVNLIRAKVQQTRNISLVIGGVFIILFIILIITVSNTITRPLRRLTRQMDKVGAGNFTVKFEAKGSYEINRLASRFNFMVDQINQLINEKYLAQISEKTSRLKALEAQINPHFLYNSLQAISTRAVVSGMKDVSQMIEALAYILRYCIKGGDEVKVSAEIDHVRKYLMLQTVRYEDRLSIDIQVDESLTDILIPKLSIQTLVENSVQHALENMTRAISIRIAAFSEDDRIIIQVSDNGPGITPDHLQKIIADMSEGAWDKPDESIGLKNLYSRLKLMYGEDARLELESVWGQGTLARIILPKRIYDRR